ncbi:hypothetical protein [Brevundimonas sp.]|uniref:hypothetical protein n=1 Tax=Brevundimonas sp. TaxID=1871086 RepID=UPI0026183C4A|nr:hypothetical protein [Brevundimonas sp.]
MLTLAALAVMATLSIEGDAHASIRPIQVAPQVAQTGEPVQLEDVVVSGRSLDRMILDFVGEVAEPNNNRGLARWRESVCVGVINLRGEVAGYIADRVSTVAGDLGLEVGEAGCRPNLLVVATADGSTLAGNLVEDRVRAFRMGGTGMDRGGAALRDFVATDRPVRWWQMSAPVDSETGLLAVRLPGECRDPCASPLDYAPVVNIFAASRLRTQIVDNLIRAVVIVDVDEVSDLSVLQLADYIAMVSLAQIDPDADTSGYASILNVFDDPQGSQSLTDWDLAYLGGLYGAEHNQINRRAGRSQIVDAIRREHRLLREREPTVVPDTD